MELIRSVLSVPEVQHTHGQNTPENTTAGDKTDNFLDLLQRLGLRDSYHKKMTKKDVLAINRLSLSENEPRTENKVSSLYLYKLMTLDYQARYLCVQPEAGTMLLKDDDDDEDFFDCDDESIQNVGGKQEQIHSMDILLAIFHCSDDFLRQYIFEKLSACQFSLPILVPNPCTEEVEFPLWALRDIKKSWQSKNGECNNRHMFNTLVPVVSFIRLGSSDYNSKSQILNHVMSKQRHDVFFHRHCRGSTPDNLLMSGVVEIAWYCPGGKEGDIFNDCVAFLNLRGNATDHPKQLEFLQAVSTVNVLLVSEHLLSKAEKEISQKLLKSPVPLICLLSGKGHIQQSKNPAKVRIAAKERNQAEFADELTSQIKQCISLNKQTTSIEGFCKAAREQQFKVDEDQKSCQDAYSEAKKLACLLKDGNISTFKERFLPLQGELWHDWCKNEKETFRLKEPLKENKSIEHQFSEILAEMEKIRSKQRETSTPLNDFMRLFLEYFTALDNSENTILYRLQWLRILLDDLTHEPLAELEKDYLAAWGEMRLVPQDKEKASHTKQMQSKLESISNKMTAATVGLPHLMREVGQLFEASQATAQGKETNKQYANSLLEIGLKMLLSGYPLELMDGDAAHVPIKWIEAVLEKLSTKFDKKVFVLSILGLQSSGKSTLLNTMFGVQFSVSAGRCTRGAFMQLIPVDSSITNQLGYDFVLIVDTEGLRSPELSTKLSVSHDNELATFVIGISDMTVINIMGENPSEMHDILQICVQAFLRMKQVKISPSCVFVHQNCAAANAGNKNIEGRRCLLQKLDEIAQMAAKEENVSGITGFSDVINFDVENQVVYFTNLLEGDPPMAPPNPSYSCNVQELKTKLLTAANLQENRSFSSFSEFRWRLSDFWKALLQENFVFSFRNTVELMVYNSLEHKNEAWSWTLRKYSLDLQNELDNGIGSNLLQDVNKLDLTERFNKVYNPLESEIEKYFKEDQKKETLIKWSVSTRKRFETLKHDLTEGILKKCKELIASKKNRSELDQKKSKYTDELTKQSKALASKMRQMQNLEEEQVMRKFDELWESWTREVLEKQPPEERRNVRIAVESILLNKFNKHPNTVSKIREGGMVEFDPNKHIKQGFFDKMLQKGKVHFDFKKLEGELMYTIEGYIRAKEDQKNDFHDNFIYEILSDIEEKIRSFEKENNLSCSSEFKVDMSVCLCLQSVPMFQKLHDDFKTANHPLTYLQSQRDKYLQSFRNYCKGANSVKIFADFFCKHIKPEVLKAANRKTSQQFADEMKNNNEALNGNRSNLEKRIMKHLAAKECFELYEEYIDSPEKYFERFIKENVEEFDIEKLHEMQKQNVETLKRQIITASTAVTTDVAKEKGSASMWLTKICEKVGKLIVIDRNELRSIAQEPIEDWTFFEEIMSTSQEEMIKEEKKIDVQELRKKCTSILWEQVQGCWVQCPFCTAVCTNTINNHEGDHSVTFHRSQALCGWHYKDTDKFAIEFCTTAVSSDRRFWVGDKRFPYKNYRSAGGCYSNWSITPDGSVQPYWKWFICRFQTQWEKKYGFRFTARGEIPAEWKKITKESALEKL